MKFISIIGYTTPWILLLVIISFGWLSIVLKLAIIWGVLMSFIMSLKTKKMIVFMIVLPISILFYIFSDSLVFQIMAVFGYIFLWVRRTMEMKYYESLGYQNMGIKIGIHILLTTLLVTISYFIGNYFNLI